MANDVKSYPIPLLFKKMLNEKKSGFLLVMSGDTWKRVYFSNGNPVYVKTSEEHERLGEIMISEGLVTRSQLEEALKIQSESPSPKRIGEILMELFKLDVKDIFPALQTQVKTISGSLFSLENGYWEFTEKEIEEQEKLGVKVKLQEVIVHGIRYMNDISFYTQKFDSCIPVTLLIPEAVRKVLTEAQIDFHNQLSSYSNIPIKDLVSEVRVPEHIFWKDIVTFYLLDIVNFIDPQAEDKYSSDDDVFVKPDYFKPPDEIEQPEPIETLEQDENIERFEQVDDVKPIESVEIEKNSIQEETTEPEEEGFEELKEMYDRLDQFKGEQIDYYRLFGVQPNASIEEIKKVYIEYSQKFHPDRINAETGSSLMDKANAVFGEISAAFSVLNDPGKRKEYDSQRSQFGRSLQGQEDKASKARFFYQKANTLFKQNKFREAAALLETSISNDNTKAGYFYLLGLCLSQTPETRSKAETHLKKASELEPHNTQPLFALGELYRSENMINNAEACFKKVLAINPDHTLAAKAIKEIGKDKGKEKKEKKSRFSLFGK